MLNASEAKKMSHSHSSIEESISRVENTIVAAANHGMQEVTVHSIFAELSPLNRTSVVKALIDAGYDVIVPGDESKLHISWS